MSYYGYELNGTQFEDRETVARALNDSSLSESDKQAIVDEHNWRHVDSMTTDSYTNRIVHGVSCDYPVSYSNSISSNTYDTYEHQESAPKPKVYKVIRSEGHLLFDDKNA